jgi:CRP-like cAMP-binding protein
MLPNSMRGRLALALHEQLLSTIPLFFQTGSEFIAEVALALVPERYNAGEKVAVFGQLADRLYVVFMGSCSMRAIGGRHISAFTNGDFFGESNLLKVQLQRTTVTCFDFSELWCLTKAKLDPILLRFPLVKKNMFAKFLLHSADEHEREGEEVRIKAQVGGCLFRTLSVQYDRHEVAIPTSSMLDHKEDEVSILRWSFMVGRILRRYSTSLRSALLLCSAPLSPIVRRYTGGECLRAELPLRSPPIFPSFLCLHVQDTLAESLVCVCALPCRLYCQDSTVRIFNRITTFGNHMYQNNAATIDSNPSTPRNYTPSPSLWEEMPDPLKPKEPANTSSKMLQARAPYQALTDVQLSTPNPQLVVTPPSLSLPSSHALNINLELNVRA